jgi:hypothetical protein
MLTSKEDTIRLLQFLCSDPAELLKDVKKLATFNVFLASPDLGFPLPVEVSLEIFQDFHNSFSVRCRLFISSPVGRSRKIVAGGLPRIGLFTKAMRQPFAVPTDDVCLWETEEQ